MYKKFNYKKIAIISVLLFIITIPIFPKNTKAQTSQTLYLNRIGFIDIEVGYDVHVVGDYAYVTNNDGLMIIDVSDPRNPAKIGEFLCGGSFGFVIESNIAYIASAESGFIIGNLSNPSSPILLGNDTVTGSNRVAILGNYAFVSYTSGGFKVFNISNLANPLLLGEFSDTRSDAVAIKDNFVYHSNAEVGLKVVNVSDPNTPHLVTTVSQTMGTADIHITGNLLFLACWGYGLRVFDISDPTSPQMLDSYDDDDGGEELGLFEKDDLLYIADNSRVEVFNVSNPNSIVEIAERSNDVGAAHDIEVDERYIYVAQGGGLLILELSTIPESGISGFLIYLMLPSMFAVILVISSVIYFRKFKSYSQSRKL